MGRRALLKLRELFSGFTFAKVEVFKGTWPRRVDVFQTEKDEKGISCLSRQLDPKCQDLCMDFNTDSFERADEASSAYAQLIHQILNEIGEQDRWRIKTEWNWYFSFAFDREGRQIHLENRGRSQSFGKFAELFELGLQVKRGQEHYPTKGEFVLGKVEERERGLHFTNWMIVDRSFMEFVKLLQEDEPVLNKTQFLKLRVKNDWPDQLIFLALLIYQDRLDLAVNQYLKEASQRSLHPCHPFEDRRGLILPWARGRSESYELSVFIHQFAELCGERDWWMKFQQEFKNTYGSNLNLNDFHDQCLACRRDIDQAVLNRRIC